MPPKQIIIDTDPGVDDVLAFLLALASPEIQLEALTTTQGNVTLEKATRNALSVLELGHASHIPVASGSMFRWSSRYVPPPLSMAKVGLVIRSYLNRRSKPVPKHAVDYLIERVLAEPNEISIFPDRSADEYCNGDPQGTALCQSCERTGHHGRSDSGTWQHHAPG